MTIMKVTTVFAFIATLCRINFGIENILQYSGAIFMSEPAIERVRIFRRYAI